MPHAITRASRPLDSYLFICSQAYEFDVADVIRICPLEKLEIRDKTIVATKIHFVGGGNIVVDVSPTQLADLLCQKSTVDVRIAA
jgi:hypothetical protein